MNSYITIETDYLHSSRTIETVVVSNSKSNKVYYVYNYEGYSFRVFETILSLAKFIQEKNECTFHFGTEIELDNFFSTVLLK